MSETGDVRQVIERAKRMAQSLAEYGPGLKAHAEHCDQPRTADDQPLCILCQAEAFLAESAALDIAEAKLTSHPAPSGWQPIESAPQMRKIIVTYINALGKRRTVMACYYKAHSLEMHDDYAEVGEYNEATGESFAPEGWYEEHDSDDPILRLQGEPTHWMPLPAPPDGQNAVDALPPAPEVKDAPRLVCPVCEEGAHIKADSRCWCGRKAVPVGTPSAEPANAPPERVRPITEPDAKDAIPPGPEVKDA